MSCLNFKTLVKKTRCSTSTYCPVYFLLSLNSAILCISLRIPLYALVCIHYFIIRILMLSLLEVGHGTLYQPLPPEFQYTYLILIITDHTCLHMTANVKFKRSKGRLFLKDRSYVCTLQCNSKTAFQNLQTASKFQYHSWLKVIKTRTGSETLLAA